MIHRLIARASLILATVSMAFSPIAVSAQDQIARSRAQQALTAAQQAAQAAAAADTKATNAQTTAATAANDPAARASAAAAAAVGADLVRDRRITTFLAPVRSRVLRQGADGNGSSFTAGGWNFAGGINRAVSLTNARRPGSPVMRLSATGTTSGRAYTKIPVTPLTGKIELWLYLPQPSSGAPTVNIAYSSDTPSDPPSTTNPTNMRKITLTAGDLNYGVWFPLTIMPGGKVYSQAVPNGIDWVTTGTPDPAEIEYLQIEYVPDANTPLGERWVDIDLVAANGKGRPMVVLGFDGIPDANAAIDGGAMLGKVRELFRRYGFRGYIAQDSDNINDGTKTIHDQLYADGWDIITQGGPGHINYAQNPSLLAGNYLNGKAALQSYGYTRGLDWFAYPFNSRSSETDAILANLGVRATREFRKPGFAVSSLGRQSLARIGSFDAGGYSGGTGSATLKTGAMMIAWLDDAIAKGESINIYTHVFKTTPTQSVDTSFAEYSIFMAYLADKYYSGVVDVVTPSEFLSTVVNYPIITGALEKSAVPPVAANDNEAYRLAG